MIPLRDDEPARRSPVVTVGLIAANVALLLLWQTRIGMEASPARGALVPARLTGGAGVEADTVFSSLLMRGGFLHLTGSMRFLWVFGNNVAENSMRPLALGRKNWLHIGDEKSGPKIAAILSIIETSCRSNIPAREYLMDALPRLGE